MSQRRKIASIMADISRPQLPLCGRQRTSADLFEAFLPIAAERDKGRGIENWQNAGHFIADAQYLHLSAFHAIVPPLDPACTYRAVKE